MHRKRNPEPLKDLLQLRDVPECIWNVSDLLDVAKFFCYTVSEQQVTYQGFTADKELVWQNIPWANSQAAFPD